MTALAQRQWGCAIRGSRCVARRRECNGCGEKRFRGEQTTGPHPELERVRHPRGSSGPSAGLSWVESPRPPWGGLVQVVVDSVHVGCSAASPDCTARPKEIPRGHRPHDGAARSCRDLSSRRRCCSPWRGPAAFAAPPADANTETQAEAEAEAEAEAGAAAGDGAAAGAVGVGTAGAATGSGSTAGAVTSVSARRGGE